MRTCSACGSKKDADQFYFKDKKTGRLSRVCKECHNAKVRGWQNQNRDKVRGYVRKSCKASYDANPEKHREKSRKRRAQNPEHVRAIVNRSYKKSYYSNYQRERARLNRTSASRRAATPDWLTAIQKAMVQEFYDLAKARECQTGVKYHVDHIMPINGHASCGLHVPWNLQILTQSENCAKKNRMSGE